MRFFRILCFAIIFILHAFQINAEQIQIQKSEQALISDIIYNTLAQNNLNVEKQLLESTLSTDFPYNIIVKDSSSSIDGMKKLILVFPQDDTTYIAEIVTSIKKLINSKRDYELEILFSANDLQYHQKITGNAIDNGNVASGSKTYIQNLLTTENTAAVIISPEMLSHQFSMVSNFSLFDSLIQVTPGGIDSTGETSIVPLGFFETIINSFAKSSTLYYLKGYFLTLYRLNLIADDYIIGIWLENEIPSVSLQITNENKENLFLLLDSLVLEFSNTNFNNLDTNYDLIQIFSQTFFITERMLLIFLIIVTAVVLFGFFNLSFVKGSHKNVHKAELRRMWYFIPIVVAITGLFLYVAQVIVQLIFPSNTTLTLFPFIVKIVLTVLFIFLFSFLQYVTRLPLTGFIYAYALSISAVFNIILFSLVEISLVPLFVGQYIIIQISQKFRKTVPIVICLILMTVPYFPLIFNIVNVNKILNVNTILNANFFMNILLAFFLLPYQLMIIRILTRFKLWGMRIKTSKKRILRESIFTFILIILIIFGLHIFVNFNKENEAENMGSIPEDSIQISHSQKSQFDNTLFSIIIDSKYKVISYYIEVESENALPIYDANFPFDILSKPFTAIIAVDNYPPNPLVLNFTSRKNSFILCKFTVLIEIDGIVHEKYLEYALQDNS